MTSCSPQTGWVLPDGVEWCSFLVSSSVVPSKHAHESSGFPWNNIWQRWACIPVHLNSFSLACFSFTVRVVLEGGVVGFPF